MSSTNCDVGEVSCGHVTESGTEFAYLFEAVQDVAMFCVQFGVISHPVDEDSELSDETGVLTSWRTVVDAKIRHQWRTHIVAIVRRRGRERLRRNASWNRR